ncbi:hypothetical protein CMQ_4478 [Grosmannia clavigera kw1407]|uniref:Ctl transporter n=1 Tax=Grosmannia clavigera (strain kw1407 / UAMH 11150) TaxID=655863 RepID=F0XTS3_GROCL|nr:uncharacterized protein CMQ_4478 [Grosmannia clavigera kw1407]EFW98626.1 hypothetical protein CMQ_4478 [Grosmannia clavigera kw1407]
MFSEYASKFLAQSQSRLSSFGQPAIADDAASLNGYNTHATAGSVAGEPSSRLRPGSDWQSSARGPKAFGRSFLSRGNPYQTTGGSRFGQLNFASRYSAAAQDAPLFHSGRGDINEALGEEDEDDEDEMERDREAADLYALQRSRRVFAASRLDESTGTDNERSRTTLGDSRGEDDDEDDDEEEEPLTGSGRRTTRTTAANGSGEEARGIQSSWKGRPGTRQKSPTDGRSGYGMHESRGKMVDIGLESTIADSEPPEDLTYERQQLDDFDGDQPPAFQQFNPSSKAGRFGFLHNSAHDSELGLLHRQDVGRDTDSEAAHTAAVADSSTLHTTAAAAATPSDGELFRHDPFFAWIYLIAVASLFATFVLVYLHTSVPDGGGKQPWGDTIYTTLLSSFHLLAIDTLVAIIVSLVWLAALRSFARPLVAVMIVAVPVVLLSFAIYPFVSSYRGSSGLQDRVMRWASVVPGVAAIVWIYLVWKGRSALRSAVDILEFASRILAANSALVLVGLGCLTLIVLWTWAWLAMFTRVFLGGSFSSKLSRFIISASSWWLGAYFVLMYIWTLSVISGVQRGTTGATVSQWYFHRNVQPAPSSAEVVSAALHHAVTTIFGSICLSTLLALAVRLPLLVLPGRLADAVGLFFYSLVPSSITTLTNPLTLTYSAIHSQSLTASAQGLSQLDFLSPQAPTTTLTPRAFRGGRRQRARPGTSAPLLPYRLAKLLLHATRFIMATALGFAGWVMTARQLRIPAPDGTGSTVRGSAYAYVVGLVASFIGWGVLGAMEGTLSGIVDAVVICYGSETRMANGGGGYCMEAAYLFGGRNSGDRDETYRRHEVY